MAGRQMATQRRNTTTPELEELRRAQAKKRSGADPSHILDKAIYQLWETINDLDQIQPERVEHYRVSIFGSSRIRRDRKSTRLNSIHVAISYAVFCLKKKKIKSWNLPVGILKSLYLDATDISITP